MSERMTSKAYRGLQEGQKSSQRPRTPQESSKHRNVKTEVDGIIFASKKESDRYGQLKILMRSGEITNVELQPKYEIIVNGTKICTYIGDFAYYRIKPTKGNVVEDVKSEHTRKLPVYRLKKKLMLAVHGIDIEEV